MQPPHEIKKDEWGIVIEFLQHGHAGMSRSEPAGQVLGDQFFSLLEVIIREDASLKIGDRIYIGDGKRDQVKFIRGRIELKDLTVGAKEELAPSVEQIVRANPERFLEFFNKATHITMRLHQLELLPGIGRKHLFAILDARKDGPFLSFEDMKARVPLLSDPEKSVVRRVLDELEDKDKYRLFVPRFERQQEQRFLPRR